MIWRTWIWRGAFIAWFMVLTIPMLVLLIPILMIEEEGSGQVIGTAVVVAAFIFIAVMHNWLRISAGKVRLGFFPIYWKTLAISEIRYVMAVEFVPMRDFAGWGIKGLAKSRNGILLGGNPPRGLMIETLDRRRYVLSFADADPILRALEEQGCTLAAGIDDVLSGEA